MFVATPKSWFRPELPDYIVTASEERKIQSKAAWKGPGTIMERQKALGYLSSGELGLALVCAGIGKERFPSSLAVLNYIVCGGASAVLNGGHLPEPLKQAGFRQDLYSESYNLLRSSLPEDVSKLPIHSHTAAALVELFEPKHGGGHYREGTVSSRFISDSISYRYPDNPNGRWSNLRMLYIELAESATLELPTWAQADARKIAKAIRELVRATHNCPA